jgi:hypothetical protein
VKKDKDAENPFLKKGCFPRLSPKIFNKKRKLNRRNDKL